MGIQLKNNASGTLATAISASDTGIVLTTGNGASFPALGAGDYFYATLESTGGTFEVIKVTARSGDSMTVVRAQEGSIANSFAAGSRIELRVTGAAVTDFLQSGTSAVIRNFRDKLRDVVSVKDFGAVGDGVADDHAAITAAIASGASTVYFPKGAYAVSQPILMNRGGLCLLGNGIEPDGTIITQTPGFAGVATIHLNSGRNMWVDSMFVVGVIANGSDAIRITNGQLATISNVMVKFAVAGIRLISGNSQKWSNILAESNQTGFVVDPDAGDNTNGCTMLGLRSVNHSQWGLHVLRGAGASGHMHSSWNISAEGGSGSGGGIRIRGGRYCYYDLYAESNPGDEYDLDGTVANYYFVKNPDNFALPLFSPDALCIGVETRGANMYFDGGFAPDRVAEQVFAASASLARQGVKMWDVTNTSGTTRTMTLSFLSYAPVGFKATVTKRDNTAGFTLAAPAGITLTGDTSTFGGFATSVKQLVISKINSTTAVLVQSGA